MSASSSAPFFEIREDQNQMKQQHSSTPTSSSAPPPVPPPQKKKRNQPGTPNPDAEVIALSPKTLMATNRFICEVCNKGFQREQNLQLHRRGHNLPWKLKQKTTKEVKRKVYLCPEPTCVHHDPSRALGDLTGIKKHYSRKHGEKKWKCEKCSKRYAVQSDWKAHSKTCGTREYRCDCGTLFSRRDSFITHRAFCDALAQESARHQPSLSAIGSHLYASTNNMALGLSQVGPQLSSIKDHHQTNQSGDILCLGGSGSRSTPFDHLLSPSMGSSSSSFRPPQSLASTPFFMQESNQNYHEEQQQHQQGLLPNKPPPFHGLMQFADLQNNPNNSNPVTNSAAAANNLFNLSFLSNSSSTNSLSNSNSNNNNNNASNLMLSAAGGHHHHFNNNEQNGTASTGTGGVDHHQGTNNNLFTNNLISDHQISSGAVPSLFSTSSVHQNETMVPHMSATALLQKAAQMGSTSSNNNTASLLRSFGGSSSSSGSKPNNNNNNFGGVGNVFGGPGSSENDNSSSIHDLMNPFAATNSSIFGTGSNDQVNAFSGQDQNHHRRHHHHHPNYEAKLHHNMNAGMGGSDRMTRDFLGVGQIVRSVSGGFQQREKQQQQHGGVIDVSSLDSERNITAPTSQSFGGGGGGGGGSFH